jgi:hypothetical protein
MVWIFLNWKATEYTITNSKIVLKEGILIRKSHYMPFNRITDITVSQGIIRGLFSIGHVVVVNADSSTEDMKFTDVNKPEDIQELIFNVMNKNYEDQNMNESFDYNISNNSFRNYNNIDDDLGEDSYYQSQSEFDDYPQDDLGGDRYYQSQSEFDDLNKRKQNQCNNENSYNYGYNDENHSNQKNPNLNGDYLDYSTDGTMTNLDRNNRVTNEKQKNNKNYHSRVEHDAYRNHSNKFRLNKNQEYENSKVAKNRRKKGSSVIDSYSKKFKKYKK